MKLKSPWGVAASSLILALTVWLGFVSINNLSAVNYSATWGGNVNQICMGVNEPPTGGLAGGGGCGSAYPAASINWPLLVCFMASLSLSTALLTLQLYSFKRLKSKHNS
jgi:hypothetical protein